ncbi:MAG: adenosine kinase [Candidatus Aminicenantes bacterium]|nr:adenosine kinase [Candidatus Aminicenantes bacterium]
MKKILGMGNALVDILVRIKDDRILSELGFPRGSMTLVDKKKLNRLLEMIKDLKSVRSTGGSVANTISGLSRLGISTGYIGKVGDDEFGEFFYKDLVHDKITANLFTGTQDTGACVSLISGDSQRTMATYLGAAVELESSDLYIDLFKGYDYFLLEGYLVQDHNLVKSAAALARQAENIIAIDLSSFNVVEENIAFLESIVNEYADIVFANEQEAAAFTRETKPEGALAKISEKCKIAVVKTGAAGSLVKEGEKIYRIAPLSVQAIDTTGAGDLYQAGFFYGLAKGYPLDICGRIGSITAGKTVEVMGAKMSDEQWQEVESLIARIAN